MLLLMMRTRATHIIIFFILTKGVFAQYDTTWFNDYFARLTHLRDIQDAKAYDSLDIVAQLARQNNITPAVIRSHIERAAVFISQKRNDEAINSYQQAIKLAQAFKLDILVGEAYMALANLYQFNGQTLEAAEHYLKAVKLFKHHRKKRTLIGLYRNLSAVLIRVKQKNLVLENMLSAVVADQSNEAGLIKILNSSSNEEIGLDLLDQTLVKEVGANGIYVIFGNAKFTVNDFETLGSYGAMRDVQRIPPGTLARIPDIPRNGSILMELNGPDPKSYIAKDSLLYHIQNPSVLEHYGGWDAVFWVPPGSLARLPKSPVVVTLENVSTIFNLNQEFDKLYHDIETALQKNYQLSNELSQQVARRNNTLQQRKILLWVFSIGIVAMLFIVLLLMRNFRQRQKLNEQTLLAIKRQEELQRIASIEKERTRIASDMHDDLGAGLSRIKFLSEKIGIKKQKQQPIEEEVIKIREYSHEMIDKMGEIVWSLNEKYDSLTDLLVFTRAYSIEYLTQNGIECKVDMPEESSPRFVSGELRRNVFLSVKEILHNVVKHAQATNVHFSVHIDNKLTIEIIDDGIGFDHRATRQYSNGLSNIARRMKEMGGTSEIVAVNGTSVKLTVPL